ncbi:MAG: hypothetical protein DRH57_05230 [Candidatus Cloacimonadota bacterium]|nr:MAG: hypothetical protein DRH57_05230 [Candidatus Cloacimonadota bacterium]
MSLYWIIGGIICIFLEIFFHGFFFLSTGISAIISALIIVIFPTVSFLQIIIVFVILSILILLLLRKIFIKRIHYLDKNYKL